MKDLTLDDSARVWVHVTNRRMTLDEARAVQSHLDEFVAGWKAHGDLLKAQAAVVHGWMVILAVDERPQQATGCSIDASVSALKQIGGLLPGMADLDVFDRMASCIAPRLMLRGVAHRFRRFGPSARRVLWETLNKCLTPQWPPLED